MSIIASEVNRELWSAIVGSSVNIPARNSYVHYFPQGHLENDDANNFNCIPYSPSIPCRLAALRFYISYPCDECFVKIILEPLHGRQYTTDSAKNNDDQHDMASFSKVLTLCDVNSGEGILIIRECDDQSFSRLNLSNDPPVQNLSMRDAHNNTWEFRYIYCENTQTHLLTTGWSKFTNAKQLVVGDHVVFMKRKSTEELFIGIRRYTRFVGGVSNGTKGVMTHIENAVKGFVFEVEYHPKVGFPDFVVSATRVETSMRIQWCAGMRVRMPVQTDDLARTKWYRGRIIAANLQICDQWSHSPWRMLQVDWDERPKIPYIYRVSPWDVDRDFLSSRSVSAFLPSNNKKLKLSQNLEINFLNVRAEQLSFPLIGSHLNSGTSFHYPPFPTTMTSFTGLLKTGMEKDPQTVSTALTIGSTNLDCSLNGGRMGDLELPQSHDSPTNVSGVTSIQLLGKTIQMAVQPAEGSCCCTERDKSAQNQN